jgi:hypothetical protein
MNWLRRLLCRHDWKTEIGGGGMAFCRKCGKTKRLFYLGPFQG